MKTQPATLGHDWWAVVLVIGLAPAPIAEMPRQTSRPGEIAVAVCGLSFKITSEWVPSAATKGSLGHCEAELRHKAYARRVGPTDPVHFWMIGFDVESMPFDRLADVYNITKQGDRWFVGEGARERPAYEIKGPGWWGLKVDSVSMRSSSRNGTGSFESETMLAVAASSDGKHTALFWAGEGSTNEALPLLLATLRFDGSTSPGRESRRPPR